MTLRALAVLSLTLILLAMAPSASADRLDPAVIGNWSGVEVPIAFRVQASGACAIMDAQGLCTATGGKLTFTAETGESEAYRYAVKAGVLTLVGDDGVTLAFRKVGGGPAEGSPAPPIGPPPTTSSPPAPAQGRAAGGTKPEKPEAKGAPPPPSAPVRPSGKGVPFEKESWGVRLTVPAGWRAAEKDGVVLMGGDSEAGLIIVRFTPQASREGMTADLARGYQDPSMSLMPTGAAQDYKAPGAKGIAGDLRGTATTGAALRGRAIGLLNGFGGGLVVFGLTSPEAFPTLQARVEAVAQSVTFSAPKMPKGAAVLAGQYEYVYVSPSGGYSREAKITLCTDGRFSKGGEMAGSGSSGSAVTSHNNGGTWSSDGDATSGQITLTYANGQSETLPYRVSLNPRDRSAYGPALSIGPTKYQKSGPGNCN